MFFELREYRILPGQMDNWVNYMEEVIIPFQVSKGMVIIGSFVSKDESDLYIWIRRLKVKHKKNLFMRLSTKVMNGKTILVRRFRT